MNTALRDNEAAIREATEAGDLHTAARLALQEHGADVQRFVQKRMRDQDRADEAYLDFALRFWTALPRFKGECPMRVWIFKIASNAADTLSLRIARRRELLLEPDGEATPQTPEPRRATAPHLRTGVKHAVRERHRALPEQDQILLLLRVWQNLSWRELAIVMQEVEADALEQELTRASARMRTRFQTVKERLRKLIEESGLQLEEA